MALNIYRFFMQFSNLKAFHRFANEYLKERYPALKAALTSPLKGFHDNIPEEEIAQKREELVNQLLSLGAKVDTKYEDGTNALSYAKSVKMRQLLMAHME